MSFPKMTKPGQYIWRLRRQLIKSRHECKMLRVRIANMDRLLREERQEIIKAMERACQ